MLIIKLTYIKKVYIYTIWGCDIIFKLDILKVFFSNKQYFKCFNVHTKLFKVISTTFTSIIKLNPYNNNFLLFLRISHFVPPRRGPSRKMCAVD